MEGDEIEPRNDGGGDLPPDEAHVANGGGNLSPRIKWESALFSLSLHEKVPFFLGRDPIMPRAREPESESAFRVKRNQFTKTRSSLC